MAPKYSKEQIERILSIEDFEYQRVELPYGLFTAGDCRKEMANLIFPSDLHNKSVLDVGAANGFYCFEAESRGASRVLGVDISEKRLRHARILADILGSNAIFTNLNIEQEIMTETYDYVLMLNVIHHLINPIQAIQQLSQITKERLYIEFPTLSDRKFSTFSSIPLSRLLNRFPLIGVSSLKDRATDQTFVFTPPAIKQLLIDHNNLFRKVEFSDSLIKGRALAICYKN